MDRLDAPRERHGDARPSGAAARAREAGAAAAALVRAHPLFAAVLAAGTALRVVVLLAYQPALFSPDSRLYLEESTDLEPSPNWPIGYAVFLRLLPLGADLAVVPLVQHVLGLAVAVLLYALVLRLGVDRRLAALAAAPVLLDAYQLNVEQYVLSEALFELLLVGAAALLLWRRPPGALEAGLAGLVLAGAALTRGIAALAFLPALLAVVFLTAGMPPRPRLVRAGAFAGAFVALLGGYVLWYHSVHGTYSLAGHAGQRLYGRVAPWVECDEFAVPAYERPLCPRQPVGSRPRVFRLVWARSSPISRLEPPPGLTRSEVANRFARRAIRGQPLAYARAVAADFLRSFSPTKETSESGYRVAQWQFQRTYPIRGYPPTWSPTPPAGFAEGEEGQVRGSLASFLRAYQRGGYTPGPLLGVGLAVALVAALGLGRARRSGLRAAAFLLAGLALAVCLGSLLVVPFSWRYQLPQLVLIPPAAVLGIAALARRDPRPPTARRDAADGPG